MIKKVYKNVDEVTYHITLKNKMKVYLLHKKGFVEKNAYLVCHFGNFDSYRKITVNDKKINIPYGTAHYLEHRMFTINGSDASVLFTNLGARCNAYTTYDRTAYYFSCEKNFYECLHILLEMLSSFTSTKEQIESERSIIVEEAKMYFERPEVVLNQAILKAAYVNHPIKEDVVGSLKSINEISYDMLKAVYDTYYDPSNLTLVVCGDINPQELENYLNDNLIPSHGNKKIKPLKINEPFKIVKPHIDVTINTINQHRLEILYKLPLSKDKIKRELMNCCYFMILDNYFSKSGILIEKWLKEGIITSGLSYSVYCNIDLECIIFYNIGDDLNLIQQKLREVFNENNPLKMSEDDLEHWKKSSYGVIINSYETVSGLCGGFVDDLYSPNDFFLEIDFIRNVTMEDIKEAYDNICRALVATALLRRK